jgi:hypothetical protein
LAWAIGWACVSLWLTAAAAAEIEPTSSVEQDVSDDLLRQALASELKGDANEWRQRLEEALTILPEEKLTNSLLGQVLVDGKWQAVDELQKKQANDPRLTEYRFRRERLNGKYRPELELARWCTEVKWNDLAKLHYARVLAYTDASESARTEACRILQLKAVDGQYMTAEELAAAEEQKKTRQQAFETWRPKIVAWRKACGSKSQQFAEQALTALREVDDPQAILAIEASLYDSNEAFAAELIKLLGKFAEFEATQALVRFALLTPSTSLAQAAVVELKPRPIHDYYPQLLVLVQAPILAQFRITKDFDGRIRYEHILGQQGPQRNVVLKNDRFYTPTVRVTEIRDGRWVSQLDVDVRNIPLGGGAIPTPGGGRVVSAPQGLRETIDEQLTAMASFLTALSVQKGVAIANSQIALSNERVFCILEQTSPQPQQRTAVAWWTWWKDYQEKQYPTPTQYVYHQTNTSYQKYFPVQQFTTHSCFLAGTPVWTESGKQAIEKLRPGDRVLSRNVETGELQFKVVLGKTLQAPSPVVKLLAGDDEIVATKSHPFWVSGKGWRMAKELVAGDVLHTLNGPVQVASAAVQPMPQEAHNLVVEGFATYFVGDSALLVHDNTYWQPTTTIVPGMRAAK